MTPTAASCPVCAQPVESVWRNPYERPDDLGWATLRPCGHTISSIPKAGGRTLDGRTWDQYPDLGGVA